MRRQSIRRDVWRIGSRRRQTGGFFPVSAIAGPIIGRLVAPILKK